MRAHSPRLAPAETPENDGHSLYHRWKELSWKDAKSPGIKTVITKRLPHVAFGKMCLSPSAVKIESRTNLFTYFNVMRGSVEVEIEQEEEELEQAAAATDEIGRHMVTYKFNSGDCFEVPIDRRYLVRNLSPKQQAKLDFSLVKASLSLL